MTRLVALELSAAFDRIDIYTLVHRLELTFGISGSDHSWVRSCLTDRKQFIRCGNSKSTPAVFEFGVLQASVLGHLLYTLHVAPVIQPFGVDHTQYADDTQLFISLSAISPVNTLENCPAAVHNWFTISGRSLNRDKSDVMVLDESDN